jgi:HD-like signal output (HDOD) protein/CheY-like chemotaxis protein
MNRRRVLFVDDEQLILQGLQRMLRGMRKEWDMSFATSASEALELMAKDPYDAVVADMRMPGMDGAQLLNEVKDRYPKSVRIILSGHADREMIMRSLGATHQYLAKPCDAENLKATLKRALALNSLLQGDPLFEPLISRIQSLPSLPSLYLKIQDELSSPDPSISRVADVIAQDPAMTAKILQLVNSAFFGIPRQISNPATAVNLLGLDTVKAVVLSAHAFSQLDKVPPYIDLDRMWSHSTLVGNLSHQIAKAEGSDNQTCSDARVAGMLHDVGKLVLLANLPEEYVRLHELATELKGNLFELEHLEWGATHAEVGAYLLGLWGLPESVVKAVALHHGPSGRLDETFSATLAVYAANAFAHEFTAGEDEPADALESDDLGNLDVRLSAWRKLCGKTLEAGAR